MVKDFPLHSLEKLAKRVGVERISKEALIELREILLEIANDIARDAVEICSHAKRVTIKKSDVQLASKKYREKL
ncbi:MAG: histone [Thermoprotei archaeon]|nr:MAG: histone [Thermoprotei archaeon]